MNRLGAMAGYGKHRETNVLGFATLVYCCWQDGNCATGEAASATEKALSNLEARHAAHIPPHMTFPPLRADDKMTDS